MNKPPYSLAKLVRYFLKLGTIGFGGPVALVGYMYRDSSRVANGLLMTITRKGSR
jgi:chromate transport protein ChrA